VTNFSIADLDTLPPIAGCSARDFAGALSRWIREAEARVAVARSIGSAASSAAHDEEIPIDVSLGQFGGFWRGPQNYPVFATLIKKKTQNRRSRV
jgi:hypothetical protein